MPLVDGQWVPSDYTGQSQLADLLQPAPVNGGVARTIGRMVSNVAPNAEQAVNNLGTAVGGALAAPGNATRGVGTTLGMLLKGNKAGAQDAARRTFSSVFANPNDAISGQEVNENAGIGSNPIAGAITSMVTDPAMMAGVAKLGEGASTWPGACPALCVAPLRLLSRQPQ